MDSSSISGDNLPMDLPTSPNTRSESENYGNLSSEQKLVGKDHSTGVESLSVESTTSLSLTDGLNNIHAGDASTRSDPTNQNGAVFPNAEILNVSSITVDSLLVPSTINSGE